MVGCIGREYSASLRASGSTGRESPAPTWLGLGFRLGELTLTLTLTLTPTVTLTPRHPPLWLIRARRAAPWLDETSGEAVDERCVKG